MTTVYTEGPFRNWTAVTHPGPQGPPFVTGNHYLVNAFLAYARLTGETTWVRLGTTSDFVNQLLGHDGTNLFAWRKPDVKYWNGVAWTTATSPDYFTGARFGGGVIYNGSLHVWVWDAAGVDGGFVYSYNVDTDSWSQVGSEVQPSSPFWPPLGDAAGNEGWGIAVSGSQLYVATTRTVWSLSGSSWSDDDPDNFLLVIGFLSDSGAADLGTDLHVRDATTGIVYERNGFNSYSNISPGAELTGGGTEWHGLGRGQSTAGGFKGSTGEFGLFSWPTASLLKSYGSMRAVYPAESGVVVTIQNNLIESYDGAVFTDQTYNLTGLSKWPVFVGVS